jgi:hypothetical protein
MTPVEKNQLRIPRDGRGAELASNDTSEDREALLLAEAIRVMEGFMASPVGTNRERDKRLLRIWQSAPA